MTRIKDLYETRVAAGLIQEDAAQRAVLSEFDRIREDLERPAKRSLFRRASKEAPKGLYLWGGVGRGKSMLMDLFVECLDVPVRRVHFHAFMQEIHAGLHEARAQNVQDALAPVAAKVISEVRCLAFDEMQITDITDAMIVGRLFEALFKAGVAVVTTSNRVPDDLYKNGLNRQLFLPFIDLLKERMSVQELISPTDYRQNRLTGARVWFSPADAEARASIQSIWDDMTGKGAATPLHITVKGRRVEIPAYRNGIARAAFHDLCGQPLGPADYLALADSVKVLILENIPALSRSNFNEAKRFVTMIDALYEAKVRLIASAKAEPEMLYLEGEGVFEFERTASRLREMQDAAWGA